MKKTVSILAIALLAAACTTSTNKEAADSIKAAIDTTIVNSVDTVATESTDPQGTKK